MFSTSMSCTDLLGGELHKCYHQRVHEVTITIQGHQLEMLPASKSESTIRTSNTGLLLLGSQCAQGNIIQAWDCEPRVSHSSQSTGDCARLLFLILWLTSSLQCLEKWMFCSFRFTQDLKPKCDDNCEDSCIVFLICYNYIHTVLMKQNSWDLT